MTLAVSSMTPSVKGGRAPGGPGVSQWQLAGFKIDRVGGGPCAPLRRVGRVENDAERRAPSAARGSACAGRADA